MSFAPPTSREITAMAPEILTVIVASVSCVAFCLVILMLVVVLYGKKPLCCRFRPDRTEHYTDDPLHYRNRQTLMGFTHNGRSAAMNVGGAGPQLPGRPFIIGKPNDYHMEGPLPRLPSYDSVRKSDRRRQIHSVIAQRFGLGGRHDKPPPTYEETLYPSHGISYINVQPLGVHLSTHSMNHSEDAYELSRPSAVFHRPAQNSSFLSL